MRACRPLAAVTLVPAGMLVAHGLGWLVADPGGQGGHHALTGDGHLAVLAAVAVPLGLAGLVVAVRDGYRGRRIDAGVAAILAGQAACFVALEVGEAAASGAGAAAVASQPALWAGLVLQLVVAWAVRALVHATAAAGSALRRWRPRA
ncbi:MAG: hypothetical protein ACRD1K_06310, partial [Acidimicrobiales bacterium]